MGSKEDFIKRLRERQKEFSEEEEMIEITFSPPRPATDEEKKRFKEFIKKARESGKDIFIPKYFEDGRVEMVNYEEIRKEQDEKY